MAVLTVACRLRQPLGQRSGLPILVCPVLPFPLTQSMDALGGQWSWKRGHPSHISTPGSSFVFSSPLSQLLLLQ